MDQPPNIRAALEAMMVFLAQLEEPAFQAGQWVVSKPSIDERHLPHVRYDPVFLELLSMSRELGWIMQTPAAGEWFRSADIRRFLNEPDLIGRATAEQLTRLLTAASYAEKFREGLLLDMTESGGMLNILRRMRALLEELEKQPASDITTSLGPEIRLREGNEMFYMRDGQKEDDGLYPDIDLPLTRDEIAAARRRAAKLGLSDEALDSLYPWPKEDGSTDDREG